jgi:hypothetical protein
MVRMSTLLEIAHSSVCVARRVASVQAARALRRSSSFNAQPQAPVSSFDPKPQAMALALRSEVGP